MHAIRKHLVDFIAVIALMVIALAVSAYILDKQRMRFPLIEEKPFVLKAEFQTAQAVIAGQGQTVRVSGVRIGDIGGVELKDGRAIVRMDIDPEHKDLVHTNATALLRPKTGLKDMFIDLEPGSNDAPVARENWTIPVQATQPDVNPDEIFATLDADTRDYLKLLISDLGRGLEGRSGDLRDVFRRFEPTHRDLARVNGAVATRRENLRRLISSLNTLNAELARKDDDLAALVDSSASVLRAFASEEGNITAAVGELPSTLRETTIAMGKVQTFAELLGPTVEKLRPAARALDPANEAVRPFAREVTPLLANDIRPFVREARPLVRDLRPASEQLSAAAPGLTRSFKKLNDFFNLLAFNPKGREGPENADRQE
ncbi:MAG: phospholipid/cholesterol/gamma-HCH transport system substrate-binding protein, partial [Thermoleophilaceae bacterium]|nr:phospholipid/cholesterol/gamma-HCH transport system substrate-binding protein [Thermoleophilaceae bacterium]